MAFAPSKGKKHLRHDEAKLRITSLMDVMTITLLFLLKTYSVSGALMKPAEGVDLPTSTVTQEPQKVLGLIVTPDGVFEDIAAENRVMIEGVLTLNDDNVITLDNLYAYLSTVQARNRELGREEKRVLTIQGDRGTPYRWILKIINTCSTAGFEEVDFVVYKESKYRG
ncbi:biopolymer transporter ExbD [bacterium]|nr:biopolymer transporter ExbD [bacterium]MBU1881078.1 biopolymer transporter ExbD [bacterium]